MSQMKAADLKVVKSLPGNDKCAECGMKHPQWASVSFGTVFCLECSGVHRSLGVHISFVRSIAMDSWTPTQLSLMKAGGNESCAKFLTDRDVSSSVPIAEKYDTDAAKLYKEVLKARAEGRPEPTKLAAAKPKRKPSTTVTAEGVTNNGGDLNGMERLSGESETAYVARQIRLREEAKARMAAKFGGSSGKRVMGGVGSGPSQGNSNMGLGGISMESFTDSFASGLGSAALGFGSLVSKARDTATSSDVMNNVSGVAGGFWQSLSESAQTVASEITTSDLGATRSDGLVDLRQKVRVERTGRGATTTTYAGFGSDDMAAKSSGNFTPRPAAVTSSSAVISDPNEDVNGIAPLTGESDQAYMQRQLRIREEAKTRMEAKFGKLKPLSSSSSAEVGNGASKIATSSRKATVAQMKSGTNDDFFSSFGA